MQVSVNLNYENYIFDLYGTLIDIHTDEEEKALWKALAKFYRAHGAYYFAGGIRRGYHTFVREELEKSEEIQVENHLRLYEWSLPILQTLKENGKKVYLLSNAQRSFTYHEMVKLDIVKYFDNIYISSDHGVKKPNPKFFEILLKKEDLDTKDCLFLGNDQECDILGAQGVGMDTWYVHTNCSPEYTEDVKATYEFL